MSSLKEIWKGSKPLLTSYEIKYRLLRILNRSTNNAYLSALKSFNLKSTNGSLT